MRGLVMNEVTDEAIEMVDRSLGRTLYGWQGDKLRLLDRCTQLLFPGLIDSEESFWGEEYLHTEEHKHAGGRGIGGVRAGWGKDAENQRRPS